MRKHVEAYLLSVCGYHAQVIGAAMAAKLLMIVLHLISSPWKAHHLLVSATAVALMANYARCMLSLILDDLQESIAELLSDLLLMLV
jgi:uncharacterized membrane protein YjjB (DUF3815 family)